MLKYCTTFFAGSIIWSCFVATLDATEKAVEVVFIWIFKFGALLGLFWFGVKKVRINCN